MRKFHTEIKNTKQFGNFYHKWKQRKPSLRLRPNNTFFLMLFGCLILASCSDDDTVSESENPTVNSISPTSGPKTTIVTISGNHFGEDPNAVQVFFNEKEATVNQVSNTEIIAVVPPKAFTGNVTIKVNDTELTGPEFNYIITDVLVSTYSGNTAGDLVGSISVAKFNEPSGVKFDSQGNLFVVDRVNHKIKKITPSGIVTTFAGSTQGYANGSGVNAKFSNPYNIAFDSQDNIYVTDAGNYKIRKITPSGVVSTFAGSVFGYFDGEGEEAKFSGPFSIVLDSQENVYVSDVYNHSIRKITPEGVVTTLAGDSEIAGYQNGTGTNAWFNEPYGLAIDKDNNIYVADGANHKIRIVTPTGEVYTLAGNVAGFQDGDLEVAQFHLPAGLDFDNNGNLYVADFFNNRIRKISVDGNVTTLAGSEIGYQDGIGADALFNSPNGLVVDNDHTVYVLDSDNHKIRKIRQE